MTTTVHVIGCSKTKDTAPGPMPARDRYTSPLFRKTLAAAQREGGVVYIASAEHGLLQLDAPIEWYDASLLDQGKRARVAWGYRVADQVVHRHPGARLTVRIWCGAAYADPLRSALLRLGHAVDRPLHGLQVGERLACLGREVRS
jgi:hypothetical protein